MCRHSAKRFSLTGPTREVDRRVNAIRADIADIALAGLLFAPHYATPHRCQCVVPSTMLRVAPDSKSRAVSELLMGEAFEVIDVSGGWAWGSCAHDRYVGYLPTKALGDVSEADTIVIVRDALVFAEADIKAPVIAHWPLGARFAAMAEGAFMRTAAGFVHARHAVAIGDAAADPVEVAMRLVGTPYRWGGRSADGIDCSGLVQLALGFSGVAAPRDSDQQRAALGVELPMNAPLTRGDLIFFPGHVGMMVDDKRMIHANAHAMAVTVEPLADVVARLGIAHPEPILARHRILE